MGHAFEVGQTVTTLPGWTTQEVKEHLIVDEAVAEFYAHGQSLLIVGIQSNTICVRRPQHTEGVSAYIDSSYLVPLSTHPLDP